MFTGIVETTGRVAAITPVDFGVRLRIDPGGWSYRPQAGDSIATNGVCLTHAPDPDESGGQLAFDVIKETLDKTNLGRLEVGDEVNLEASLRADTPLAGHFVQGHIDGTAEVEEVIAGDDEWRVTLAVAGPLLKYLVPKGSVAIDGVSLTIAAVDAARRRFDVALIPTTLERTNLSDRKPGDAVNIETDILARTVVHYLELQQSTAGGAAG